MASIKLSSFLVWSDALRGPYDTSVLKPSPSPGAANEATGRTKEKRPTNDVSDRQVVVLGPGNLGLIYLMGTKHG